MYAEQDVQHTSSNRLAIPTNQYPTHILVCSECFQRDPTSYRGNTTDLSISQCYLYFSSCALCEYSSFSISQCNNFLLLKHTNRGLCLTTFPLVRSMVDINFTIVAGTSFEWWKISTCTELVSDDHRSSQENITHRCP